jgi:hypothetical protein
MGDHWMGGHSMTTRATTGFRLLFEFDFDPPFDHGGSPATRRDAGGQLDSEAGSAGEGCQACGDGAATPPDRGRIGAGAAPVEG